MTHTASTGVVTPITVQEGYTGSIAWNTVTYVCEQDSLEARAYMK